MRFLLKLLLGRSYSPPSFTINLTAPTNSTLDKSVGNGTIP